MTDRYNTATLLLFNLCYNIFHVSTFIKPLTSFIIKQQT